jgi:hypothetical protein
LSCHESGDETGYLFINDQLQEINWFKERYGAWFLGDYVCEGMYNCKLATHFAITAQMHGFLPPFVLIVPPIIIV